MPTRLGETVRKEEENSWWGDKRQGPELSLTEV